MWHDGTPMDDSKVDNVIYRKKGDKYYANTDFLTKRVLYARRFGVKDNTDVTVQLTKCIQLAKKGAE